MYVLVADTRIEYLNQYVIIVEASAFKFVRGKGSGGICCSISFCTDMPMMLVVALSIQVNDSENKQSNEAAKKLCLHDDCRYFKVID